MSRFQESGGALSRRWCEPERQLGDRWKPDWAGLGITRNRALGEGGEGIGRERSSTKRVLAKERETSRGPGPAPLQEGDGGYPVAVPWGHSEAGRFPFCVNTSQKHKEGVHLT